jgi:hypothetical protein
MVYMRSAVITLVTTLVTAGVTMGLTAGVVVSAQAPATVGARHVRSAPIQVARRVGEPVMTAVGSFIPLRPSTRLASIIGFVQTHMGVPVPNAGEVIIRDVRTGRSVGTAHVNHLARFDVRSVPPGLYTAELIAPSGSVLTSTAAFTANAGEVIQLAQTIPVARAQGFSRIVSTATSAALTTAASSGVLAVGRGANITPGR